MDGPGKSQQHGSGQENEDDQSGNELNVDG